MSIQNNLPTPKQAAIYREAQQENALRDVIAHLINKLNNHDFSRSRLILPYGDICMPSAHMSQYELIEKVIELLHAKGWFTDKKSDRNIDYLIISDKDIPKAEPS